MLKNKKIKNLILSLGAVVVPMSVVIPSLSCGKVAPKTHLQKKGGDDNVTNVKTNINNKPYIVVPRSLEIRYGSSVFPVLEIGINQYKIFVPELKDVNDRSSSNSRKIFDVEKMANFFGWLEDAEDGSNIDQIITWKENFDQQSEGAYHVTINAQDIDNQLSDDINITIEVVDKSTEVSKAMATFESRFASGGHIGVTTTSKTSGQYVDQWYPGQEITIAELGIVVPTSKDLPVIDNLDINYKISYINKIDGVVAVDVFITDNDEVQVLSLKVKGFEISEEGELEYISNVVSNWKYNLGQLLNVRNMKNQITITDQTPNTQNWTPITREILESYGFEINGNLSWWFFDSDHPNIENIVIEYKAYHDHTDHNVDGIETKNPVLMLKVKYNFTKSDGTVVVLPDNEEDFTYMELIL